MNPSGNNNGGSGNNESNGSGLGTNQANAGPSVPATTATTHISEGMYDIVINIDSSELQEGT